MDTQAAIDSGNPKDYADWRARGGYAAPRPPRYWVLLCGGYSNTPSDYIAASSQEHAKAITRRAGDGFMASPGAHVFAGDREPWAEHDAYPDYTITEGPRGGMTWERA